MRRRPKFGRRRTFFIRMEARSAFCDSDPAQKSVRRAVKKCGDADEIVNRRGSFSCEPVIENTPRNAGFFDKGILRRIVLLKQGAKPLSKRRDGFIGNVLAGVLFESEQEISGAVEEFNEGNKSLIVRRPLFRNVGRQFGTASPDRLCKLGLIEPAFCHEFFERF